MTKKQQSSFVGSNDDSHFVVIIGNRHFRAKNRQSSFFSIEKWLIL